MNPARLAIGVSLFLFVGMMACLETGYRIGLYASQKNPASHEGTGTIGAAVFALLGLLLGFTFANGISHLDQRRELIVHEANAIGTAYLRLDLLPVSQQTEMRRLFREYLNTRLEVYQQLPDVKPLSAISRTPPNCSRKSGPKPSSRAPPIRPRTWPDFFCPR